MDSYFQEKVGEKLIRDCSFIFIEVFCLVFENYYSAIVIKKIMMAYTLECL